MLPSRANYSPQQKSFITNPTERFQWLRPQVYMHREPVPEFHLSFFGSYWGAEKDSINALSIDKNWKKKYLNDSWIDTGLRVLEAFLRPYAIANQTVSLRIKWKLWGCWHGVQSTTSSWQHGSQNSSSFYTTSFHFISLFTTEAV